MNKWNKQRKRVTKRRDELQNELLSNETSKNDEDIQTLLESLNETLKMQKAIVRMDIMENLILAYLL